MASEIVENDNVTGPKRWDQHLFDPRQEADAIDRAIEDVGRDDPFCAQPGKEGHGSPVAVRGEALQTLALGGPASQGGHVGLDPCFIDKNQLLRIKLTLEGLPSNALPGDGRPRLFKREQGFF